MSLNLFRRKPTVGIDIGQFAIRVAEVAPTSTGWELQRYGWVETPKDTVRDGVVLDPQSVGLAIKRAVRESHVQSSAASLAVGGGSVIVRAVNMPQMSEATLRKSIRFEAGRYVPTSIEDSFIEFEILGDSADGQMRVLMVAAPKDIVNSRVQACEFAGLEPESVDVEVFAAYRALIEARAQYQEADKTLVLVDVGFSKTNLAVVRHGEFAMTRSLPHGGNLLSEALMKYFKLSVEEAEEGKSQLDLSVLAKDHGPQENPPLRVVQPHVDDLIREIRRSLNYFQSQLAEEEGSKNVDMIVLTGGGSKLAGLAEYASSKLKVPTEAAGVLGVAGVGENVVLTGAGNEAAVAVGLAMRSYSSVSAKAA
ncbi:MAG: type IV pilus assembly protein PilM [Armatimonadetes bacterium]|nr:type IV pilus assembly protein PilM [Armatimonadota bacterium]